MPEADLRPLQWKLLTIGIKPQRHRSAGPKRREQKIVGAWPAVESAGLDRFVGQQTVSV